MIESAEVPEPQAGPAPANSRGRHHVIDTKMEKALNDQIVAEFYSAYL